MEVFTLQGLEFYTSNWPFGLKKKCHRRRDVNVKLDKVTLEFTS